MLANVYYKQYKYPEIGKTDQLDPTATTVACSLEVTN